METVLAQNSVKCEGVIAMAIRTTSMPAIAA